MDLKKIWSKAVIGITALTLVGVTACGQNILPATNQTPMPTTPAATSTAEPQATPTATPTPIPTPTITETTYCADPKKFVKDFAREHNYTPEQALEDLEIFMILSAMEYSSERKPRLENDNDLKEFIGTVFPYARSEFSDPVNPKVEIKEGINGEYDPATKTIKIGSDVGPGTPSHEYFHAQCDREDANGKHMPVKETYASLLAVEVMAKMAQDENAEARAEMLGYIKDMARNFTYLLIKDIQNYDRWLVIAGVQNEANYRNNATTEATCYYQLLPYADILAYLHGWEPMFTDYFPGKDYDDFEMDSFRVYLHGQQFANLKQQASNLEDNLEEFRNRYLNQPLEFRIHKTQKYLFQKALYPNTSNSDLDLAEFLDLFFSESSQKDLVGVASSNTIGNPVLLNKVIELEKLSQRIETVRTTGELSVEDLKSELIEKGWDPGYISAIFNQPTHMIELYSYEYNRWEGRDCPSDSDWDVCLGLCDLAAINDNSGADPLIYITMDAGKTVKGIEYEFFWKEEPVPEDPLEIRVFVGKDYKDFLSGREIEVKDATITERYRIGNLVGYYVEFPPLNANYLRIVYDRAPSAQYINPLFAILAEDVSE